MAFKKFSISFTIPEDKLEDEITTKLLIELKNTIGAVGGLNGSKN